MPSYHSTIRSSWHGFDHIRFLFIFGDSYSSVGAPKEPIPTKDEPLGIMFPGITYNEPDEPNWVGYLVTQYHSMLVYDYARGGHTIAGVTSQVQTQFLHSAGRKPEYAPWNAHNSLFVTWIGINDCAYRNSYSEKGFEKYQDALFEEQEALYLTGARNFLFIDVPPIDKSPANRRYSRSVAREARIPYPKWNSALNKHITKFTNTHPEVTTMVFSSHDTFMRVIHDPSAYGFDETEAHEAGGPIWFDFLHPSSGMHAIIAREVAQFLFSHPAIPQKLPANDPSSRSSISVRVTASWPGLNGLKNLIIFGASYCDVGYNRLSPHPTLEQPMGVSFPGVTWAEPGKPNWVGHLVNKLKDRGDLVLVYNFALGGEAVDGVGRQIHKQFLPELALHPTWAPWTTTDTLFVIWVGINDCASMNINDVPACLEQLFNYMHTLYSAGARNFLFIDLPPVDRSPSGERMARAADGKYTFEEWNDNLRSSVAEFADGHSGATALIYSSYMTVARVLDDPAAHDFRVEDVGKAGGSIWCDHLHPSSKLHDVIAQDVVAFLSEVSPPRPADAS